MALKDLVSDGSKLTEAAIEEIVRDYVRYDPDTYEVVLTPAGLALSNDAKVLVLLVGIAGWQYVVDEVRPVDTQPAALEQMTGIAGGTLRPILKKLKDAHLVVATSQGYAIRVANLAGIGGVVARAEASAKPTHRARKRAAADEDDKTTESVDSSLESGGARGSRRAGVPISGSLTRLVHTGFFEEERTLAQVVGRLHEMAIIAKTTSLSGPIADLVREGRLTRKKVAEGGRDVWSYKSV